MKEQIYTIPINEHFEKDGGCPVCGLAQMLETESLDYAVSPAMMEPDVRQEMNKKGFCSAHYKALLTRQKRLSLALVLESRLKYLEKAADLTGAASGCYVCARVSSFMDRMYANIVYLWLKQPEFRAKLEASEHICLPHISGLLMSAKHEAGKKEYAAISAALHEKARASLSPLADSVSTFCKSFDHRFAGIELGEHKLAVERAIAYLSGEDGDKA